MIKNFGDTANGKVSGSIPNGNLRVPEWKNVDVVGNLINMYYANEKNNRENEALQLGKAKQDLAEQMFAYNALNDEIGRQIYLKTQEMQNQNNLDKIKLENSLKNEQFNKLKAEEDLKAKKANEYYGALEAFENLVGGNLTPQEFYIAFHDHHKWLGTPGLVDYYTNNPVEAANIFNLYIENRIKRDEVGGAIQKSSGNGSRSKNKGFYDKLMIEHEKDTKEPIKDTKEPIKGNIDNSEIKGIDGNLGLAAMGLGAWSEGGKSIGEEIKSKLKNANLSYKGLSVGKALNTLASGGKAEDILQMDINWSDLQAIEKEGTRQLERMAELQKVTFESDSFLKKYEALADTDKYKKELNLGLGDLDELAPAFGNAIRKQLSEEDFAKDLQKRYPKITKEDIRDVTEAYKDVSSIFNQEMNSKLNDISLKNYDAIIKVYEDYKEYYGKDSETFKSLKNPKDIFGKIKGSSGKERMYVSALLATLPTEDLIRMLKDQDSKGFNAIMDLLDSRPDNSDSFTSAITKANKVLGNMGSNTGPDIINAVMLYNSMGLDNLISMNPNIANLSINDRVYRNIMDKDGNIIGKEDTGLLMNRHNPMMFVELAKLIKGLEDKRKSYNKTQPIENRIDW